MYGGGQGAKIMDIGEDMNVDRVRMRVVIGQKDKRDLAGGGGGGGWLL